MLQRGQISQNTCNYLTADIDRTQQFYLLPKIHKDLHNPLGRLIVSGISYIRDLTHMINILNEFSMPPGMLLCTLDITSLYTNIPHNEGIQSIKEMLAIHRCTNNLPHNSYIGELLEVVLTNNYFDFNGKH